MRFTVLLAFLCGVSLLLNVECFVNRDWNIATQWLRDFNVAIESRERDDISGMISETARIELCSTWNREKFVNHLSKLPKDTKYSINLNKGSRINPYRKTIYMVVETTGLFNLGDGVILDFNLVNYEDHGGEIDYVAPSNRTICKSG